MQTFTDSLDREWSISLTIGTCKRIKSLLDCDLLNAMQSVDGRPPLLTRLGTDVVLLVDMIFVAVKPQAEKLNISDEQFAEALGGEAAGAAVAAFYTELESFYQGLGRPHEAKAVAKQRDVIAAAAKKGEERVEALDVDSLVSEAMDGKPSTG